MCIRDRQKIKGNVSKKKVSVIFADFELNVTASSLPKNCVLVSEQHYIKFFGLDYYENVLKC